MFSNACYYFKANYGIIMQAVFWLAHNQHLVKTDSAASCGQLHRRLNFKSEKPALTDNSNVKFSIIKALPKISAIYRPQEITLYA